MNAPLAQDHYTPEDLLRWEPGYELLDGRLVEKPMGTKAGVVESNIDGRVNPFVRQHALGVVIIGDGGGYELWPNRPRVRKADLSFVARGRFPDDVVPDGWARIPPDLAVEVASPNDNAEDLMAKAMEWLSVGTRLVWVVYPKSRTVLVLRAGGIAAWVGAGGQLSGEDVLPGFTCPIDDVFAGV
ncbi:MAG TPA: Uma2 family endonuclease [Gemmataceae bacterium]|nr:Uma2 family endonuclease [Gemmataceae bacterium]